MKIAVTFLLLSMMVLISHQQRFQHFANFFQPWSNRHDNIRDFYDYLYARSLLHSINTQVAPLTNPISRVNQAGAAHDPNANQWPDVQSKSSGFAPEIEGSVVSVDEALSQPRVFLNYVTTAGGTSSYFNPFLKTVYYITSLTATTTVVKSCIPAGSFNALSSTVTCRKRRDVMSILIGMSSSDLWTGNEDPVSPSQVLPLEPSREARSLPNDDDAVASQFELLSSQSDEYTAQHGIFQDMAHTAREKRLLAASSTITSYVFVTTTSTKTLSSFGTKLSCIPSVFALC